MNLNMILMMEEMKQIMVLDNYPELKLNIKGISEKKQLLAFIDFMKWVKSDNLLSSN